MSSPSVSTELDAELQLLLQNASFHSDSEEDEVPDYDSLVQFLDSRIGQVQDIPLTGDAGSRLTTIPGMIELMRLQNDQIAEIGALVTVPGGGPPIVEDFLEPAVEEHNTSRASDLLALSEELPRPLSSNIPPTFISTESSPEPFAGESFGALVDDFDIVNLHNPSEELRLKAVVDARLAGLERVAKLEKLKRDAEMEQKLNSRLFKEKQLMIDADLRSSCMEFSFRMTTKDLKPTDWPPAFIDPDEYLFDCCEDLVKVYNNLLRIPGPDDDLHGLDWGFESNDDNQDASSDDASDDDDVLWRGPEVENSLIKQHLWSKIVPFEMQVEANQENVINLSSLANRQKLSRDSRTLKSIPPVTHFPFSRQMLDYKPIAKTPSAVENLSVSNRHYWSDRKHLLPDSHFIYFKCSEEGLTKVPLVLASFCNLFALDISANAIEDFTGLPETLRFLVAERTHMRHFNDFPSSVSLIYANFAKSPRLESMSSLVFLLPSLVHLNVSSCSLCGSLPALPRELRYLNISGNELSDIDIGLENCWKLQVLNASQNRLSIVPRALTNCPFLRIVSLDHNSISEIPVFNLHFLRSLWLSHNHISLLSSLGTLPLLEDLRLNDNNISRLVDLGPLYSLKTLDLSFNQIDHLSGLSPLESLRAESSLIRLQVNDNIVCRQPHYRRTILLIFPNLLELDSDIVIHHSFTHSSISNPVSLAEQCLFKTPEQIRMRCLMRRSYIQTIEYRKRVRLGIWRSLPIRSLREPPDIHLRDNNGDLFHHRAYLSSLKTLASDLSSALKRHGSRVRPARKREILEISCFPPSFMRALRHDKTDVYQEIHSNVFSFEKWILCLDKTETLIFEFIRRHSQPVDSMCPIVTTTVSLEEIRRFIIKRAARIIQRWTLAYLDSFELRMRHSVVVVQRHWRKRLFHRRRVNDFERRRSSVVLQRCYRSRLKMLKMACDIIGDAYINHRRRCQQRDFEQKRMDAANLIGSFWLSYGPQWKSRRRSAALVILAHYRGMVVRRLVREARAQRDISSLPLLDDLSWIDASPDFDIDIEMMDLDEPIPPFGAGRNEKIVPSKVFSKREKEQIGTEPIQLDSLDSDSYDSDVSDEDADSDDSVNSFEQRWGKKGFKPIGPTVKVQSGSLPPPPGKVPRTTPEPSEPSIKPYDDESDIESPIESPILSADPTYATQAITVEQAFRGGPMFNSMGQGVSPSINLVKSPLYDSTPTIRSKVPKKTEKTIQEWGIEDPNFVQTMIVNQQKYVRLKRRKAKQKALQDPTIRLNRFQKKAEPYKRNPISQSSAAKVARATSTRFDESSQSSREIVTGVDQRPLAVESAPAIEWQKGSQRYKGRRK